MSDLAVLPFSIADTHAGFARAQGLMRMEAETLVVEFEIKESLLGVLSFGRKEVRIPIRDVDSATLKKSWWGTTLILQFNRLEPVTQLPKVNRGRCHFSIARPDRAIAASFAPALQLQIADSQLSALANEWVTPKPVSPKPVAPELPNSRG